MKGAVLNILESLWDVLVLFFFAFVLLGSLIAVVMVLSDLFRDRALNGWAKAAWIVFLVFVPLLTSLVYLIARGGSMPDRINEQARARFELTGDCVNRGPTDPADEPCDDHADPPAAPRRAKIPGKQDA